MMPRAISLELARFADQTAHRTGTEPAAQVLHSKHANRGEKIMITSVDHIGYFAPAVGLAVGLLGLVLAKRWTAQPSDLGESAQQKFGRLSESQEQRLRVKVEGVWK